MIQNSTEWVDKLDPVEVAMAALCEAGRPDLANRVYANRAGWPSMAHADNDTDVVVRAFWLAHKSTGHRCDIAPCITVDGREEPGIVCIDCEVGSADMQGVTS